MTGDVPIVQARSAVWSLSAFSLTLLCVLLAFYFEYLSGQRSYYVSDLTYYYEPLLRFIGEALAQNRLPLWNPYNFCGMSQIAISAPGVFYPPNWLFAAMPFNQGLATIMLSHQWIAGLGGYLLVRLWGWGKAAAWLCGLTLALCGYMFALQFNHPLAATAAWVPISLWGVSKIGAGGSDKNLLLVSLSSLLVFMLISSGRPEIFGPGLLALGGFIVVRLVLDVRAGNDSAAISATFWRCLPIGIGVLLSMPAMLPLAEWTALSPRAAGMPVAEVFRWSANWYDYLCLFLAQPLGDLYIFGNNYLALVATRSGFIPYVGSAFISPMIVTLAFLGAFDREWRWRWLVVLTLAGSIIATLGRNTVVFPAIVAMVPMLTVFRYPIKLMILPVWCLIVLGSRGLYLCMTASVSQRALMAVTAIWTLILALSITLLLSPELVLNILRGSTSRLALAENLYVGAQTLFGQAGLIASGCGLATCALIWGLNNSRVSRNVAVPLLLLATGSVLTIHAFTFARQAADGDYFAKPVHLKEQLVKLFPGSGLLTGQSRALPLYFDPLVRPEGAVGHGASKDTIYFYQYTRQLLFPNTNVDAHIAEPYGYEGGITIDDRRIFHAVRNKSRPVALLELNASSKPGQKVDDLPLSTFCRMTATEVLLTQCFGRGQAAPEIPMLSDQFFEMVLDDRAMNVRIYRVKDFLPRAYLARSWTMPESHAQAVDQVANPDVSGFDPGKQTLVEPRVTLGYSFKSGSVSEDDLANSWVKFLQDSPEHVSLSIKAKADGLVVLADHDYPGWHARLDGIPTDVHLANALQRAVYVKAGSHLLEFDYEPDSLSTGFACAKFGFFLILGLLLFAAGRAFWAMAKHQSRGW